MKTSLNILSRFILILILLLVFRVENSAAKPFSSAKERFKVEILDIQGHLLSSQMVDHESEISFQMLAPGSYRLIISECNSVVLFNGIIEWGSTRIAEGPGTK